MKLLSEQPEATVTRNRKIMIPTSHRRHRPNAGTFSSLRPCVVLSFLLTTLLQTQVWAFMPSARFMRLTPPRSGYCPQFPRARIGMVLSPPPSSQGESSAGSQRERISRKSKTQRLLLKQGGDAKASGTIRSKRRKKYNRKREKPITEKENDQLRRKRQEAYEQMRINGGKAPPSIWGFESLFPEPVWDEESVERDLYGIAKRDKDLASQHPGSARSAPAVKKATASSTPNLEPEQVAPETKPLLPVSDLLAPTIQPQPRDEKKRLLKEATAAEAKTAKTAKEKMKRSPQNTTVTVDYLSQKVEESVYGYRRTEAGSYYDSSLVREGAVQFRDGVRLGRALVVNLDRLNYYAKNELKHGRVEEAQEFYEKAVEMDPRDGRAYLGLSRIAQRRRDFKRAKEWLRVGIANAVANINSDEVSSDVGANPFLLQALGCLEERMGHLSEAEAQYIAAVKSKPTHAAAWVSLAQLRTRKLRQGAAAGRICYQTAERELKRANLKPSSYVYTAWASLEYKKAGDVRKARELFQKAIDVDPKCSAAWLQLGVLETNKENWAEATECFETVLKFDQRNSRVLQAYALMETKRPDGDSRKAIDLFERALKVNPRDAGVLQPYALYVAKLGDIDAARDLLQRGTEVNKRHAPVWQAWGVLETRYGTPQKARDIFQQGIWACAQLTGGQSGGYRCARLWQAWGVLEAREGDYAAARRCFNRALDADNRNVATITAWTQMEADIGNYADATHIFERALKQFPSSSEDKLSVWRSYELMEQRAGHVDAAQQVYERYMRESFQLQDETQITEYNLRTDTSTEKAEPSMKEVLKKSDDLEVVRWDASSLGGEIWMNKGSIEGKFPESMMKKKNTQKGSNSTNLDSR